MIDAAGTHVIYEVKHLEKSFGKVEVLKDINIQIGNGEVLTIIGPSGSGKSTFLRCLNLLEKPTDLCVLTSVCIGKNTKNTNVILQTTQKLLYFYRNKRHSFH